MYGIGKTDIGKVRNINEDSIFVSNEKIGPLANLYIVADGIGGHKAGEIASLQSIIYFREYINNNTCNEDEYLDFLISAVKYANDKTYEESLNNSSVEGMGTTFSVCSILDKKIFIAHIGDSRIYKISSNSITQLTVDHTYVNEMKKTGQLTETQAENHPNKNVLTRALGIEKSILIDGVLDNMESEDKIILCSDGLYNMLTNMEILEFANKNTENIIDEYIKKANEHGGEDNISVILVQKER